MQRQNNFDKYTFLRNKYHTFSLEGFESGVNGNSLSVKFRFSVDDTFHFSPTSAFFMPKQFRFQNSGILDAFIFQIALVELISYWKAFCPPNVVIKSFHLSHDQISWWKKLWFHGLGEFFWLNSIEEDSENFMNVVSVSENKFSGISFDHSPGSVIIPVGGGKDSAVTLEFFRSLGTEIYPMLVNPRGAMINTLQAAGIVTEKSFLVNRMIDPLLFVLNEKGYLNGHTPFSSLLAFHSALFSAASGITDIALSNESSANESTVPGTKINHQYSKSFEFETDFRNYINGFLSKDINYFSALRPLSELQIAGIFSRFERYFSVFRSCNAGSKQDAWCGKCPKCLFTAIILLPFSGPEKLKGIFSADIFDNPDLIHVFRQLTGIDEVKPFECVGTPEEINFALNFAIPKYFANSELPFLLKFYKNSGKFHPVDQESFSAMLTNNFDENHYLNSVLYGQLREFAGNIRK